MFCTCEDKDFTCTPMCTHMHVCQCVAFWFLILHLPTHIDSEASNFTTFVLMLLIIILGFIDWRHGWCVFCTCEYEDFTCMPMYAHFIAFWLLILHLWLGCSVHVSMRISHACTSVFFSSLSLSVFLSLFLSLYICSSPWYSTLIN